MKDLINFLAGMFVGAVLGVVAALFLAPQSGAELRANLQDQAATERQRFQDRYDQQMSKLQAQLENVNKDVQAMFEQAKKAAETENTSAENE